MWQNKYKMIRNHKLLPNITTKHTSSKIRTYAILNHDGQQQYELKAHPTLPNAFVMFNQNQFLQRQCSKVIIQNRNDKTLKIISENFPETETETLTFFISNHPKKTDQLLLGINQTTSLLSLAFNQVNSKKELSSSIFLSIIGVENENKLTDQLYFQWLLKGQKLLNQPYPLKAILAGKQKVTLTRQGQNQPFYADNITRHKIESQQNLRELLGKYRQVKNCLEEWVQNQNRPQQKSYLMGQIYVLSQGQYQSESSSVVRIKKSHYIFRINQYNRLTSPLLLSLSITLKHLHNTNTKLLEVQNNKAFKVISKCFRNQQCQFFLFLQVGQYLTLKEEHLCLASTSEFMTVKSNRYSLPLYSHNYIYSKSYLQNPTIMKVITDLQGSLCDTQKKQIEIKIKQHQQSIYPAKVRVKTRSYQEDTACSVEKKMIRQHLLTEEQEMYPKYSLEELVHQTGKIFRVPSYKKESISGIKTPISGSKGSLLSKMKKLVNRESNIIESTPSNSKVGSFMSRIKTNLKSISPKQLSSINSSSRLVNSTSQTNKHYFQIREWLDQVYGQRQTRKIKNFYNSIHKGRQLKTQFLLYSKEGSINKRDEEIKEELEEDGKGETIEKDKYEKDQAVFVEKKISNERKEHQDSIRIDQQEEKRQNKDQP